MSEMKPNQGPLAALGGAPAPAPKWFDDAIACRPESHFVTVEGAPIHYLSWGDRARPGVLLVHGKAAHARWWSFIAPYLARDFHVVAIDLSGMGDSGWRPTMGETSGYSMALYAREEMAVCEDAGLFAGPEKPVIIGHSFGGMVTMLAAGPHGERLKGVVIIDSLVNHALRTSPRMTPQAPRPHNVYPGTAAALARFKVMPAQECENLFLLDWVARTSLKDTEDGVTWKFDPEIWRNFDLGDTEAALKAVSCRIAVFRGEQSSIMPPAAGDYVFGLLGGRAPVIEIPEARHHIMLDQPLALVSALRTLLAEWQHSAPKQA